MLAERGNAAAEYAVGTMYDNGEGVARNDADDKRWAKMGADLEEIKKRANGGNDTGDPSVEHAFAEHWVRLSAQQGYSPAEDWMGATAFNGGAGAAPDFAEAARWWRSAVAKGNASARCNLGAATALGKGVPKDPAEGLRLLKSAFSDGETRCAINVANLYSIEGSGVTYDLSEALRWYTKAARAGEAQGQYDVGIIYAYGKGVEKDYAKAAYWIQKAADQGDAGALYMFGSMHIQGDGVPKDPVKAYAYLTLAAGRGHQRAEMERVFLRYKLSDEELDRAKAIAAAWRPHRKTTPPW